MGLADERHGGRPCRQPRTTHKESAIGSRIKQQILQDFQMAGLSLSTQQVYLTNIVVCVRRTAAPAVRCQQPGYRRTAGRIG